MTQYELEGYILNNNAWQAIPEDQPILLSEPKGDESPLAQRIGTRVFYHQVFEVNGKKTWIRAYRDNEGSPELRWGALVFGKSIAHWQVIYPNEGLFQAIQNNIDCERINQLLLQVRGLELPQDMMEIDEAPALKFYETVVQGSMRHILDKPKSISHDEWQLILKTVLFPHESRADLEKVQKNKQLFSVYQTLAMYLMIENYHQFQFRGNQDIPTYGQVYGTVASIFFNQLKPETRQGRHLPVLENKEYADKIVGSLSRTEQLVYTGLDATQDEAVKILLLLFKEYPRIMWLRPRVMSHATLRALKNIETQKDIGYPLDDWHAAIQNDFIAIACAQSESYEAFDTKMTSFLRSGMSDFYEECEWFMEEYVTKILEKDPYIPESPESLENFFRVANQDQIRALLNKLQFRAEWKVLNGLKPLRLVKNQFSEAEWAAWLPKNKGRMLLDDILANCFGDPNAGFYERVIEFVPKAMRMEQIIYCFQYQDKKTNYSAFQDGFLYRQLSEFKASAPDLFVECVMDLHFLFQIPWYISAKVVPIMTLLPPEKKLEFFLKVRDYYKIDSFSKFMQIYDLIPVSDRYSFLQSGVVDQYFIDHDYEPKDWDFKEVLCLLPENDQQRLTRTEEGKRVLVGISSRRGISYKLSEDLIENDLGTHSRRYLSVFGARKCVAEWKNLNKGTFDGYADWKQVFHQQLHKFDREQQQLLIRDPYLLMHLKNHEPQSQASLLGVLLEVYEKFLKPEANYPYSYLMRDMISMENSVVVNGRLVNKSFVDDVLMKVFDESTLIQLGQIREPSLKVTVKF